MRLSDANLCLRDIDLGGLDAESDYKLAEDFVATSYVTSAIEGRRTLFLGRKGSGKSALFMQLPKLLDEHQIYSVVVSVTPDQYAWAALKQYQEQGLLAEQAHTNAWKLTLAIEVAAKIVSLNREWPPAAQGSVDVLKQFISTNYGTELKPGLLSTATSVVKGLKSFNLSAFGFGVGLDRGDTEQPLTPSVISALIESLRAPLAEQPGVIELDRLDDSWDGSEASQTLLVGLLKAAKDINDGFAGPSLVESPLRVLVFLRSDIYDGLQFDDKDKHRITEEHISWTSEGLREMLTRRLPEGVGADDIFEQGEMRGRVSPFNYIVKRTFLRPREVLQFVQECIAQSERSASEIRKDDIRAAEDRYSRWKVDDLKQEYRKVRPEFEVLLEALRQEVHRYDTLQDLEELLAKKAPTEVDRLGRRRALELLFEASVIGIRLRGAGHTRFKADDLDLSLPSSGTVYVHQSLYKGLNIVEARASEGQALVEAPVEEDDSVREGQQS